VAPVFAFVDVDAVGAVASEAGSAVAFVAAENVDAARITRADSVASFALVDIITSSFRISIVSRRALAFKRARNIDASCSFRVAVVVSSCALVDVFAGESVAFESGAAGALVRAERVRANRVRRTFVSSSDAFVLVFASSSQISDHSFFAFAAISAWNI